MNCADVNDLMGAYAIGAVSDADAQLVRDHMTTCRRHDLDLEELRSAARRIAASAEPIPPPSHLRSRVLAAIDAEAGANIEAPVQLEVSAPRAIRSSRQRTWWLGSAAAAAIVALLVWNVVLLRRTNDGLQGLSARPHVVTTLHPQGTNGTGTIVYFPDEKKALVLGDGLQPLERNVSTYQLWEIAAGQPKSIGLMQADASGQAMIVVPFDGQIGHTLAVTIEPAGGSAQPTSNPILAADLFGIE
jgi:anti-sigma-K factor RskA